MVKLFRTSIEQTGAAIFTNSEGEEKVIPLFTEAPCEEARELRGIIPDYELKDVYYTNNFFDYKLEDLIRNFINKHGFLPENYMDELVSGFPGIVGRNDSSCCCYI